jgi:hypothetical protein
MGCHIDDKSSAFFSTSNRMFVQFEGDGSFSLERFEQTEPDPETWQSNSGESGKSRMIYNLRDGALIVDSRSMAETSQCMVEIPLGRLSLKRALVGIEIEFDPRSEIFSFSVICSDGQIRFADNRGETYTLRTGQRLVGAGSRMTPSIEIGEVTEEWSERVQDFKEVIERYRESTDSLVLYQAHFQAIDRAGSLAQSAPLSQQAPAGSRPIAIERASQSAPVTPFRGEIPPPSSGQADIF